MLDIAPEQTLPDPSFSHEMDSHELDGCGCTTFSPGLTIDSCAASEPISLPGPVDSFQHYSDNFPTVAPCLWYIDDMPTILTDEPRSGFSLNTIHLCDPDSQLYKKLFKKGGQKEIDRKLSR